MFSMNTRCTQVSNYICRPHCHRDVSSEAPACPHCGRPMGLPATKRVGAVAEIGKGVGHVVLGILGLGLLASLFSDPSPSPTDSAQRAMREGEIADRVDLILMSTRHALAMGGTRCSRATRARIRRLVERHALWSDDMIATIACGWIQRGMTAEQLGASWGEPEDAPATHPSVTDPHPSARAEA